MNSRQKGAAGERELARALRGYGYDTRRGQQYSGQNGDADVVGLPGIHIECKRAERLDLLAAMAQAVADARPGELPAVFHRRNHSPWMTTIRLEDWIELYREWEAGQEWRGNVDKSGWVSVKDKLPEEFQPVLVYRRGGKVEQGSRDVGGWWRVYGSRVKNVTRWMPLPEPPEPLEED